MDFLEGFDLDDFYVVQQQTQTDSFDAVHLHDFLLDEVEEDDETESQELLHGHGSDQDTTIEHDDDLPVVAGIAQNKKENYFSKEVDTTTSRSNLSAFEDKRKPPCVDADAESTTTINEAQVQGQGRQSAEDAGDVVLEDNNPRTSTISEISSSFAEDLQYQNPDAAALLALGGGRKKTSNVDPEVVLGPHRSSSSEEKNFSTTPDSATELVHHDATTAGNHDQQDQSSTFPFPIVKIIKKRNRDLFFLGELMEILFCDEMAWCVGRSLERGTEHVFPLKYGKEVVGDDEVKKAMNFFSSSNERTSSTLSSQMEQLPDKLHKLPSKHELQNDRLAKYHVNGTDLILDVEDAASTHTPPYFPSAALFASTKNYYYPSHSTATAYAAYNKEVKRYYQQQRKKQQMEKKWQQRILLAKDEEVTVLQRTLKWLCIVPIGIDDVAPARGGAGGEVEFGPVLTGAASGIVVSTSCTFGSSAGSTATSVQLHPRNNLRGLNGRNNHDFQHQVQELMSKYLTAKTILDLEKSCASGGVTFKLVKKHKNVAQKTAGPAAAAGQTSSMETAAAAGGSSSGQQLQDEHHDHHPVSRSNHQYQISVVANSELVYEKAKGVLRKFVKDNLYAEYFKLSGRKVMFRILEHPENPKLGTVTAPAAGTGTALSSGEVDKKLVTMNGNQPRTTAGTNDLQSPGGLFADDQQSHLQGQSQSNGDDDNHEHPENNSHSLDDPSFCAEPEKQATGHEESSEANARGHDDLCNHAYNYAEGATGGCGDDDEAGPAEPGGRGAIVKEESCEEDEISDMENESDADAGSDSELQKLDEINDEHAQHLHIHSPEDER
ncbi:unnamed protein product [Amoebophrya sp. A120]|nr:unnamed protein product [Amoebophrya sp. A120]|eukprot:GSA120T00016172001.1